MNRHLIRLLLAVLALALLVGACGDDDEGAGNNAGAQSTNATPATAGAEGDGAAAKPAKGELIKPIQGASSQSLTIGSKNFPEQFVLGQIYSQALRAAGYKVKTDLNLGDQVVADKTLKQGDIDAYPEYTGTALTSFFDVKLSAAPKAPAQAYEDAKAGYAKNNITAFPPTPFENTYRLGMLKKTAERLGNPTKISDLQAKASTLNITGYPECRQRPDCQLGVEETYGMKFKKFVSSTSTYQVLKSGDADVAFVFTTDGDLASDDYVVLDDDKKFFPPYNITLAMRNDAAEKLGPEGRKLIENVQSNLTNENMQELNARVVLDKEEPAAAAKQYLETFGYIAK